MKKPLMFDLYCGLGGATEGFLAEGWHCIGIDIERHQYGDHRYPAQLWIQDIDTINGAQLRDADFIWASPPCQKYSYMATPWTRSKAMAAAIRADESGEALAELNRLFDACFRIQREACEAAGRHIPLIVENVRGAQPWVGRARWNYGSFYLFGDVPALMPMTFKGSKVAGFRFDGSGKSFQSASVAETGHKSQGMNWSDQSKRGQDFTRLAGNQATKNNGGSWFNVAHNTTSGKGQNPDGRKQRGSGRAWWDEALDERRREATAIKNGDGLKVPGIELGEVGFNVAAARQYGAMVEGVKIKRSADDKRQHIGTSRKFASAMIAKIPLPLSRHIAAVFRQGAPT